MSIFKNIVGGIDDFANSINPMKQPMQWLTDNTIGKIPVVGKPAGQLYDYSNSHPLESLGAMAALYGGAAYLGGAGAGGGLAAGAGGVGAAGAGADGLGALGTTSGFGGAGLDAGATGFGAWGTSAGTADVGGLASLDSAAVGSEGAAPGLMDSYGPASSSFNLQGFAKQAFSQGMKGMSNASQGRGYSPVLQSNSQMPETAGYFQTPQQKLAQALMTQSGDQLNNYNPAGAYSPMQGLSSMGNAMLAAQLLKQMPQT